MNLNDFELYILFFKNCQRMSYWNKVTNTINNIANTTNVDLATELKKREKAIKEL